MSKAKEQSMKKYDNGTFEKKILTSCKRCGWGKLHLLGDKQCLEIKINTWNSWNDYGYW